MGVIKAVFFNLDESASTPIPVMFNPPEYNIRNTNKFIEINTPGVQFPKLQFISKEIEEINMTFFFDTSEQGIDVQMASQPVVNLAKARKDTKTPPKLLLVWGTLAFSCVMTSVVQTFKAFSAIGFPVRSDVKVTLKGYNKLDGIISKISDNVITKTIHTISTAKNICEVASNTLGDERKWKQLAKANNMSNPLNIKSGMKIKI